MEQKIAVRFCAGELNYKNIIMETQLKKGDTFIRISKYGKVFGVVDLIFSTKVISDDCDYEKVFVKSIRGIDYDLSECHKVTKKLSSQEIERRKILLVKLDLVSKHKYEFHFG